jgi:hypothetical protein
VTVDAAPTTYRRGTAKLTPARKEQLLRDIAKGDLHLEPLAASYGITYGHCRDISYENKEEIQRLREEFGEMLSVHWISDKLNRLAIRKGAVLTILDQQAKIIQAIEDLDMGEAAGDLLVLESYKMLREQWSKLEALKLSHLRQCDELVGDLPTRAPAVVAEGSKMTYEVKGVDVAATVREWAGQ